MTDTTIDQPHDIAWAPANDLLEPLRFSDPEIIRVEIDETFLDTDQGLWLAAAVVGVACLAPQHTFLFSVAWPLRMRQVFDLIEAQTHVLTADLAITLKPDPRLACIACVEQMAPVFMPFFESALLNHASNGDQTWPPHNLWVGLIAENQIELDFHINLLSDVPASLRYIELCPMTGPVEITDLVDRHLDPETTHNAHACIDWVIVSGNAGASKPLHPKWVYALHAVCARSRVPFFFCGWGNWTPAGEAVGQSALTGAVCIHGRIASFNRNTMKVMCNCDDWCGLRPSAECHDSRLLNGRVYAEMPVIQG